MVMPIEPGACCGKHCGGRQKTIRKAIPKRSPRFIIEASSLIPDYWSPVNWEQDNSRRPFFNINRRIVNRKMTTPLIESQQAGMGEFPPFAGFCAGWAGIVRRTNEKGGY